jgi:hypothetical protein
LHKTSDCDFHLNKMDDCDLTIYFFMTLKEIMGIELSCYVAMQDFQVDRNILSF